MPTTIDDIKSKFNIQKIEKVNWNEKISNQEEGIYIVTLPNFHCFENLPISDEILTNWINKTNGFTIDKNLTTNKDLILNRLKQFWLPDENILYIGKAPKRANNKGIGNRVNEFYRTKFGDSKPHAGGHWIKLLEILNNCEVHFFECHNSGKIEIEVLEFFINNVSDESKKILLDTEITIPFANLEFTKGKIKKHGLGNMKI